VAVGEADGVVAVGDGSGGVEVVGGVGVGGITVGVEVSRGVGGKLDTAVDVGEENLTGTNVGVGGDVDRELAAGKSAKRQDSKKMDKVSKAKNRVMHHHQIITPTEKNKP
jgi:hypothetical protein